MVEQVNTVEEVETIEICDEVEAINEDVSEVVEIEEEEVE